MGLNLGYGFKFESSWISDNQSRESYLFYKEDYYKPFAGVAGGVMVYYRNFTLNLRLSSDFVTPVSFQDMPPFSINMFSINAGYAFKLGKAKI